jgi:hypothetical protein
MIARHDIILLDRRVNWNNRVDKKTTAAYIGIADSWARH